MLQFVWKIPNYQRRDINEQIEKLNNTFKTFCSGVRVIVCKKHLFTFLSLLLLLLFVLISDFYTTFKFGL